MTSLSLAMGAAIVALVVMATVLPSGTLEMKDGFVYDTSPPELADEMEKIRRSTYEGFNTRTPPSEISNLVTGMKNQGFVEGFNTNTKPIEIANLIRSMKDGSVNEGFVNTVSQNISRNYSEPGFGLKAPLVEGYEDVKKKKGGKQAPAAKEIKETKATKDTKASKAGKAEKAAYIATEAFMNKDSLAMPFTLGEIPSQVKNGPHIDAGSTLMNAIKSLNPDQINAMTKDTQQLIETQKSLMGMLGTMKPMLNDGKELMDTFQQMFGK
jgi:hypothetical protein